MSNPTSLPPLIEGYGRKRKKRTSIETNIKLTLEKRFLDVSSRLTTHEESALGRAQLSVRCVCIDHDVIE